METIFGHEHLDLHSPTVATIGTFDGVHLGHRAIIEATIAEAKRTGQPSLLMTFDVHPREFLRPSERLEALTSLDDKLELLAEFGLDYVCILKFCLIAKLSAADFYEQVLHDKAQVSHLFVGENFRFGAGAAGDASWLRAAGAGEMSVTTFPLEKTADGTISSTAIRGHLRDGTVDKIPSLLGRHIALSGRVVRGAGRGAGLGFPTANIEFVAGLCDPANGVYIAYLQVDGERLPSVVNCGNKPTFGGESFSCEAHILDYQRELYGKNVKLELAERIRSERKFPSPEALRRQITDYVNKARTWFSAADASR